MYAGSGNVADGVEVGVRVAMALDWERPHCEAVEGHSQRRLTGVARRYGRTDGCAVEQSRQRSGPARDHRQQGRWSPASVARCVALSASVASSKQRCAAPVESEVVAVATVVESGGGLEEEEGNGGDLEEEEEEEYGVRRLLGLERVPTASVFIGRAA